MSVESQHYPTHCLYVVATPIGNLADITKRAEYVLTMVDWVACEDTRVAKKLFHGLGFLSHPPLLSVHARNEHQIVKTVLEKLQNGARIAYISDAGTPAISDPGAYLVNCCHEHGIRVMPIPGACAFLTLASAAGLLRTQELTFIGFLPTKAVQRNNVLKKHLQHHSAIVFYEAPHRIHSLLKSIHDSIPNNWNVIIGRELTKKFESIYKYKVDDLPDILDNIPEQGEYAIILYKEKTVDTNGNKSLRILSESEQKALETMVGYMPVKEAVNVLASLTSHNKNDLYKLTLNLKKEIE